MGAAGRQADLEAFGVLPELHWRYGYAMFWLSVGGIALRVAWLSKRARLL
jgi:hypothetical protein